MALEVPEGLLEMRKNQIDQKHELDRWPRSTGGVGLDANRPEREDSPSRRHVGPESAEVREMACVWGTSSVHGCLEGFFDSFSK